MKLHLLIPAVFWLATVSALLPARKPSTSAVSDDLILNILKSVDQTTKLPVSEAPTSITTNEKKGCGWTGGSVLLRSNFPDDAETERAEFGELKWTVAIFNKYNNSYACVGSLIHPSVVLTVGHWFSDPSTWEVRAGDWKLSAETEYAAHQTRDVGEVIVHPKMNKGNVMYDIALLFLKEPFAPAPHIGFVCLPPQGAVEPTGEVCKATGWGLDKYKGNLQDILKEIELPIMARSECQTRLQNKLGLFFELHSTHVCAGGEKGKDTCQRDGGSPLVCPYKGVEDRYYQVGLAAGGLKCGEEGLPALYTNVAALRGWIDEKVIQKGYTTDTYTA